MELGEAETMDPNPDIHALFCHYNNLYFGDSLGACILTWSSKRMTLCAGVCHYLSGGGCEIRLSEPLLKFRSIADLKNTLLHEMIHAYLWIKNKNRDHSDHGPSFQKLMKEINSSSLVDYQRPVGGYSITIYHSFHDEVDSYRVHHWMCQTCGDLIKRAMNREPSASDCIEKVIRYGFCGNPSCHWHGHKKLCGGDYTKIAEPHGYEDKRMKKKGKQAVQSKSKEPIHSTSKSTRKTSKAEGRNKDNSDVKKFKSMKNFYPVLSNANDSRIVDSVSSSSDDDFQNSNNDRGPKDSRETSVQTPVIGRNYVTSKKHKSCHGEENEFGESQKDYTVIIKWKEWYANEEEGEECVEPLRDNRMERRRRQKLIKSLRGGTNSSSSNRNQIISEDVAIITAVSSEDESATGGKNKGEIRPIFLG